MMKKRFAAIIVAVFALCVFGALVGCGDEPEKKQPQQQTYEYSLNKTTLSLEEEQTFKLEVTVTPSKDVSVEYTSLDASVASVAEDGTVTAVAAGSTTVNATVDGKTLSCAVTVTEKPAPPITYEYALNETEISLEEEQTFKLEVTVTPSKDVSVEYTSLDASVASVAEDGTVTAIAAGSTTVNATVDGETLSCAVTVTAKQITPTDPPSILTEEAVKTGVSGERVAVDLTVSYDGEYTTAVTVKRGDTPIALEGELDNGTLSFVPYGAGIYKVSVVVSTEEFEPVTAEYEVEITSLGKTEMVDGEGLRYISSGAAEAAAGKTMVYLSDTAVGSTEVKFKLANAMLHWEEGAFPHAAFNKDFMAVMVIFARADGKFDLVALDFSKAYCMANSNIAANFEDTLPTGYIIMRLYVGATTPSVAYDDAGWEISERAPHGIGSADVIFVSFLRRIVKDGDTLKAQYNVSFNVAKENITNYTFDTLSDYTGEAALALASAYTGAEMKRISVNYPVQVATASVAAGEVDINGLAAMGGDWTLSQTTVTDSEGNDVALTGGKADLSVGTYTVVYTATSVLNNSATYKTAVFTVILTVT